MTNKLKHLNAILQIDKSGMILDVVYHSETLKDTLIPHQLLVKTLIPEVLGDFLNALISFKEGQQVFNQTTLLALDDGVHPLNYHLLHLENKHYMVITDQFDDADRVMSEFMKINNQLLNQYRQTFNEKQTKDIDFDNSPHLFEELSLLNSQLVNTQRELAKNQMHLERLNKDLLKATLTDPLTGLGNRRKLTKDFIHLRLQSKRYQHLLSVIQVDLNDFKKVNDTLGHDEGDQVLIHFANCSNAASREGVDFVYRIGGDEFVIMCTNTSKDQAKMLIQRIGQAFSKYTHIASIAYGIVALDPDDPIPLSDLLVTTDDLMYQHKKATKKTD